jgi:hypothetical protein
MPLAEIKVDSGAAGETAGEAVAEGEGAAEDPAIGALDEVAIGGLAEPLQPASSPVTSSKPDSDLGSALDNEPSIQSIPGVKNKRIKG